MSSGRSWERIQLDPVERGTEPDDCWKQTQALLYLGLLAGRSIRAVMALFRLGYDAEALTFKRRLDEIHARAHRVVHDQHGAQRARDWLQGKDRKASSVVEPPPGAWAKLSHVAHADYRAVENHLLSRQRGDGFVNFAFLPMRDITGANATLVLTAMQTRDVAEIVATFMGWSINGADELDTALGVAAKRWIAK